MKHDWEFRVGGDQHAGYYCRKCGKSGLWGWLRKCKGGKPEQFMLDG